MILWPVLFVFRQFMILFMILNSGSYLYKVLRARERIFRHFHFERINNYKIKMCFLDFMILSYQKNLVLCFKQSFSNRWDKKNHKIDLVLFIFPGIFKWTEKHMVYDFQVFVPWFNVVTDAFTKKTKKLRTEGFKYCMCNQFIESRNSCYIILSC
jgi:hypothetical protein